ncbi:3-hydroxyanthranilate 3,4-dioxygenase [Heptranchias perlo]|uniref:3-hydroxyanthranilate 3,4-dioxygenase n=1 Tax=Heptranchias perlo TaxID=212740 RepID=UPI003559D8D5
MGLLYNVEKWIEDNKKSLKPPVSNKLMHSGQLKVMFVGGPNDREDYHLEEGEELFYQLKGDMCLKILEKGKHKDVHIREGEMFLLPARIPHSPRRPANTIGLVFERMRLKTELDAIRYYEKDSTDVLFEKWFYCEDLGTQLVPIIMEFESSDEKKTGKSNPGKLWKEIPFHINTVSTVMEPFSFQDWRNQHHQDIEMNSVVEIFSDEFQTRTTIYANGESEGKESTDIWIWQLEGTSDVVMDGKTTNLTPGYSLLIPLKTKYLWTRPVGSIALYVVQDPALKKSNAK